MHNTDLFLYDFVKKRNRLTVPKAAEMMDVTAATWRSWAKGTTGMNVRLWPRFNLAFGTTLHPENVRSGGPASAQDMDAYRELLDKLDAAPKHLPPSRRPSLRKKRTGEACRALRGARSLTAYEAAEVVGVSLAKWNGWATGRVAATRLGMARIKAATPLEQQQQEGNTHVESV